MQSDAEKIKNRLGFAAADRYVNLIYPEKSCAADFISPETLVFMAETSRLEERARNYVWQCSQDMISLIEGGSLDGGAADFFFSWEEICEKLGASRLVMGDSFSRASYGISPKTILNLTAKQLPSYGGSFETAAEDILHYIKSGYRTVVLSSDKRRAALLLEFLEKRGVPAMLDYRLIELPQNGVCSVSVGALSSGFEYPALKLAAISEGQLTGGDGTRKSKHRVTTNRQRLQSYADLSPGDLVVHDVHGIAVSSEYSDIDGRRKKRLYKNCLCGNGFSVRSRDPA
jgi:transcription-repair coupling factor (superfamily II helicase)